jgi:S1/P1 Nuclease
LNPPTFPTFTTSLASRINSQPDSFLSSPTEWISCVDPDNIESCAVTWAKESNAFTCSYVYGDNFDTSVDLAGTYLDGATPIVETQIAKGTPIEIVQSLMIAGLRLGVFLNILVTGQPGWGQSQNKFTVQH